MYTMQLGAVTRDESAEMEVPRLALGQEDLAEEMQTVRRCSDSDEDEILGWDVLAGRGGGRQATYRRSW
jgi:hypothetical protein